MNPNYAPPKYIGSAILGGFGYNTEAVFEGKTVEERSYDAWQRILVVLKGWVEADAEDLIKYIKEADVDPDAFLDYQDPFKPVGGTLLSKLRDVDRLSAKLSIDEVELPTDHILVDNGVIFDGTREQFEDAFFSNADNQNIEDWCVKDGFTLKINNKEIK